MKKKIKINLGSFKKYVSKCCGAGIDITCSPDFIGDDPENNPHYIGTCSCICSKCGKFCDIKRSKK